MAGTESGVKKPQKLVIAFLIIALGAYLLVGGYRARTDNKSPLITPNRTAITIETVSRDQDRALGLSGRESIDDAVGMLFVFDETVDTNCFWMKDMQFAIDMIWLDEQKQIVTVTSDVSPDTYPESFCPESAAKYGLELGAGRAEQLGIKPGETVKF